MQIITAIYTRVTTDTICPNGFDYKLRIVQEFDYDNNTTDNSTILEFGKLFNSVEDVEKFKKTKEFKRILKITQSMAVKI